MWLGIADAAVETARRFVRKAARAKPGTTPPGALRLAEVVTQHQQLAELVHGAAARFDAVAGDDDVLTSVGFAIAMNNVKLLGVHAGHRHRQRSRSWSSASPATARTARSRWAAWSATRTARALMVNNDRIAGNTAQLLLVHKD